MPAVKIEQFEGPLSLLLQLIEEQQMDITKVSLTAVTDQYLACLKQMTEIPPAELADFLVIAAKLLFIKSQRLLPGLAVEEDDDLEKQLKIFQEYASAAKKIKSIVNQRNFAFTREKLLREEIIFNPPPRLKVQLLAHVFSRLLKALEPLVQIPRAVMTRVMNLQEKIQQVKDLISRKAVCCFGDLAKKGQPKLEIIVTFLALLELVKQHLVVVRQEKIFADIVVQTKEEK